MPRLTPAISHAAYTRLNVMLFKAAEIVCRPALGKAITLSHITRKPALDMARLEEEQTGDGPEPFASAPKS
ncbi:MAG: hypothetical protein ACT4O4_01385 [Nitrospiraceae bacterium]